MRNVFPLVMALALLPAPRAGAQQPAQTTVPQATPAPRPAPSAARQALQQQLKERMGQVVRKRLQLTDAQYARLRTVNQKYEGQRARLLQQERGMRQHLRTEVLRGTQADQSRVSTLLDQIMTVQQSRLDVTRQEQRELAGFLTPVQRARYAAVQEQVRRRIGELRRQRQQRRAARQPRRATTAAPNVPRHPDR